MIRLAGWYNKWHAQIMSDILLPLIQEENPPSENMDLDSYKNEYIETAECNGTLRRENHDHMMGLYLVREVFRNLGMTSTEKIFEEEAGLKGTEKDFQEALREHFGAFTMSSSKQMQPPIMSQLLYRILRHHKQDGIPARGTGPYREVKWGVPQQLDTSANAEERFRRFHTDLLQPESRDWDSSFSNPDSFEDSESYFCYGFGRREC